MKIFDWEKAKERNNLEVLSFLKEMQYIPITEDKFIEEWSKLRIYSRRTHPSRKYSPHRGRRQYRILKEQFGFFK